MKQQINTIREALEVLLTNLDHAITAGAWRVAEGSQTWDAVQEAKKALTALDQIEAMAGEPVATVTSETGNPDISMSWWHEPALPVGTKLYAAPVAQQPRCPLCNYQYGHQIGCKNNPVDIALEARATQQQQQQAEAVPPDVVRDAAPIPDHELVTMYDERPTSDLEMIEFAREVERRHGIGVQPQHITDGSPCWCNPDVAYTDPETGASVIVHRRPQ